MLIMSLSRKKTLPTTLPTFNSRFIVVGHMTEDDDVKNIIIINFVNELN